MPQGDDGVEGHGSRQDTVNCRRYLRKPSLAGSQSDISGMKVHNISVTIYYSSMIGADGKTLTGAYTLASGGTTKFFGSREPCRGSSRRIAIGIIRLRMPLAACETEPHAAFFFDRASPRAIRIPPALQRRNVLFS